MTDIDSDFPLAQFTRTNETFILHVLGHYENYMRESAKPSMAEYERGQADPVVKAAQDASMITNNGYRQIALMAVQNADKAKRLADELSKLVEED